MNWYNQGTYETLLHRARMARLSSLGSLEVGASGLFLNERSLHEIVDGACIQVPGAQICAEQLVVGRAVFACHRRLLVLATTCQPCGGCLQLMSGFSNPETLVVVDGVGVFRLRELLPRPFMI